MAFVLPGARLRARADLRGHEPERWQDVGRRGDFTDDDLRAARRSASTRSIGDAGKTTVYVRKFNPDIDKVIEGQDPQPYVAISTRCAHLGCPVRYIQASQKFVCPCHGGVYDFQGKVHGGPPVRPLDRFYTRSAGRSRSGDRFSLNSQLERFSPRDPSNHLDGLWQYLYPSRPTT